MSLVETIAAPFKTMRKDQLRKSEFIFFLAIDRKWMNKDQAHRLFLRAQQEGLLSEQGGILKPAFDLAEITIPLGYRPPSDIFEEKEPVPEILGRIARARGVDVTAVASELNAVIENQFDGNIMPEAAVVILAKRYSVPFEDMLEELKKSIGKSSET